MTRFNFSKLVCLVVKSAGTVNLIEALSGKGREFCKALPQGAHNLAEYGESK